MYVKMSVFMQVHMCISKYIHMRESVCRLEMTERTWVFSGIIFWAIIHFLFKLIYFYIFIHMYVCVYHHTHQESQSQNQFAVGWREFLGSGYCCHFKVITPKQYVLEFILLCSMVYVSSKCINKNTSIHFFNYTITQKLGKYINALYGRWNLGLFN